MENYFYENVDQKIIKEALLTSRAQAWADVFIHPNNVDKLKLVGLKPQLKHDGKPFTDNDLKSNQLRKFHLEVKEYEYQLISAENRETEFKKIRPLIKMLMSKVAYACPLKPSKELKRKIPLAFKKFIDEMITHIETCDDFLAFSKCFEAVVGFYYGQGGRES